MTEGLRQLDPGLNRCPQELASIHLIGICGTAMAALAAMLKQSGYRVSGSDGQVYPPMSDFLRRLEIPVTSGYRADNLAPAPDLVIVGNVVSRPNPEAQELARLGLPYLSLPQALSRFYLSGRTSLVVAGTHGKTTTSAMLASALYDAGGDPGFMIGGIVRRFESNCRIGGGPWFVSEGDEYDTAFFDKGSKFLHYRPDVAIITSLEFDHADIFTDLDQIKRSFRAFVALLPPNGLLVAHSEDPHVAEVVAGARCRVESYGLSPGSDWRVGPPRYDAGTAIFTLHRGADLFDTLTIRQSGRYNCLNAAAVAAVLHHLGYRPEVIREGLHHFDGVKRRQEVRGVVDGITVIDDFAHHPTAVRETLKGLKQAYPDRRLIAVFEPRSNTSRRAIFQGDYAEAFGDADVALIREVATDKPVDDSDRFSSRQLAEDLRARGRSARACADTDEILAHLEQHARPGDLIAVLSNGGFDNIHQRLLEILRDRRAPQSR